MFVLPPCSVVGFLLPPRLTECSHRHRPVSFYGLAAWFSPQCNVSCLVCTLLCQRNVSTPNAWSTAAQFSTNMQCIHSFDYMLMISFQHEKRALRPLLNHRKITAWRVAKHMKVPLASHSGHYPAATTSFLQLHTTKQTALQAVLLPESSVCSKQLHTIGSESFTAAPPDSVKPPAAFNHPFYSFR